ncbi:Tetratricopeptide-like helical [Penicillium griseofulvum]|uniref:Tetratricopeptide-like helical n=1 Tax=Penicillium patulum TaxID=5078 RepID=A0A135LMG4_PENPA|nr:Tetratricopeptide-like helical [Penicillium griseofulvum]KXG50139.1 Tetratricopeptide-like helical [Penicillium griseofulvum]
MSSSQVASLWTEAIKQYETIAKQKLEDSTVLRVTTVEDLLKVIDDENSQFNGFRDRGHRVRDVVKHAMIPIELLGNVVGGCVSMAYPPSAYVFSGVKLLLGAAKGVSDKYDAIIETMSTLKDFTVRLQVYSEQTISEYLSDKLTQILTALLEVLAFARKEVKHGRMVSYGKSLLSGSDGGKEAMAKFARLVEAENALVGAETLTEVKGGFARVNSDMKKLVRQLEETKLQTEMSSKERITANLRRLLRPSRTSEDRYTTMHRNRVPQTGDWILDETEFSNWITGKKPVLWISGNPGAGKSYIATNLIYHLMQKPDVSLGFFFFKDDNTTTRSTHQALRDIAFQIAEYNSTYANHIIDCLDRAEDIRTLESLWRNLFLNFFIDNERNEIDEKKSSQGPVYLVLDALDEAFIDDRLKLFELAKDIRLGGRIQLLMLGRPQIAEEMDDLMETLHIETIDVSEGNNREDIMHYIRTIIAKSIYLRKLPAPTKRTIIETLSSRSQGMFLWVGLMLEGLSKIRNTSQIQKTLDEAPKGLTKMISHVLRGFSESCTDNPQYAAELNELLAWITCAPSPLSLFQIDALLKWRSPEGEGWIWPEGSLRVQFASIFLLTRDDGLSTTDLKRRNNLMGYGDFEEPSECDLEKDEEPSNGDFDSDPKTTTVSFSHASLGEFFRSQEDKVSAGPNSPYIGVNYHEAQALVLSRCFEIIQNKESSREELASALRPYACRSLVEFLTAVDMSQITKDNKKTIGLQLAKLLSNESGLKAFVSPDHLEFFTRNALRISNKWLGDPDVQEALPDEIKIWYSNAMAESPAEVLRPIVCYIASHWTRNTLWDPIKCLRIFAMFNELWDSGISNFGSLEDILQIADWGQPEHDAHWYGRVGQALRILHFDEYIEYLQKALEMDPELWEFRSYMASMYRDQSKFTEALGIYQTNIILLNEKEQSYEISKILHHEYESVSFCYSDLGNKEKAFSVLQTAYDSYNGHCATCARLILDYYHNAGDGDLILDFFQMMKEKSPSEDLNHLTEFLLEQPDMQAMTIQFGPKIIRRGCFTLFKEAFTAAIITARQQKKAILAAELELSLSFLLQCLSVDPEGGARICERILETYKPSQAKGNLYHVIRTASNSLCSYYFQQCCRVDRSEAERLRYGQLLERLVMGRPLHLNRKERNPEDVTQDAYLPQLASRLTLGIYYKRCGRDDDAQKFFKSLLQRAIRPLSWSDGFGNRAGFLHLVAIFAAMRDYDNWLSLWYQIDFLNDKIGDMDAQPFCDGCGRLCTIDGLVHCWRCDMEFIIVFCVECFPRLKDGSLSVGICDRTHEFMTIPPRPQCVKERSAEHQDMMYVNGDWMEYSDWESTLKEKYGLEEE